MRLNEVFHVWLKSWLQVAHLVGWEEQQIVWLHVKRQVEEGVSKLLEHIPTNMLAPVWFSTVKNFLYPHHLHENMAVIQLCTE